MQSKCSVCKNKKSPFVKEQKAKGLLSNLGINTPFSKIPLLNVLFEPSYAWNIFATLLHEMGPWGPTKGHDQLTR